MHNTAGTTLIRKPDHPLPSRPPGSELAQLSGDEIVLAPGSSLCRISLPGAVTTTGFELDDVVEDFLRGTRDAFEPVGADPPPAAS